MRANLKEEFGILILPASTELLARIARGDVDLKRIAAKELKSRRLNVDGTEPVNEEDAIVPA